VKSAREESELTSRFRGRPGTGGGGGRSGEPREREGVRSTVPSQQVMSEVVKVEEAKGERGREVVESTKATKCGA
jgi:hypothetical protein